MAGPRHTLGPVPLPPEELLEEYADYLARRPLAASTQLIVFRWTVLPLSHGFTVPEQVERETVPGWSKLEHARARSGLRNWHEFLEARQRGLPAEGQTGGACA